VLAVLGREGIVKLHPLTGGREHSFSVRSEYSRIGFSPDGRNLGLSGPNGVTVYETGGSLIGAASAGVGRRIGSFSFTDKRTLQVATLPKQGLGAVELTTQPFLIEDLTRAGCEAVTRSMSRDEWKRFLADRPYRQTCADRPPKE
jgi:hypothetical protein